ncbi:MAG: terpene cyclase/mutase family protein [Phycisphaerae bacterium]|nr:terpene cyclase/mutase family protein [Phycisphaerae bacterium]
MRRLRRNGMAAISLLSLLAVAVTAASGADDPLPQALRAKVEASIDRGLAYLASTQAADGGWEAFGKSHPGVTALVLKSFLQDDDYGVHHAVSRRGIEYLMKFVQPDGGIYPEGEGHNNYNTSVAIMALASAGERYEDAIRKARDYLKKIQWDSDEGHERSSAWYGGAGYGRGKRPDLSNTQFMVEALHESGLPPDDPAYRKAMVFISRCQMLSETNDQSFAGGSSDGGFIYSPNADGESKAGTVEVDGKPRLRSYGSMTYAGFKSMLYADLKRDDPRVVSAFDWIRRYYTLDQNPNMPEPQAHEGLYYFYHTFARALQAWGQEVITDGRGIPHPWRAELCEKLFSLQRPDGSWLNEEDRWYEGNPALVTAYSILAMQTALDTPEAGQLKPEKR